MLPQLALANCDEEARAARTRASSAGPLHFESMIWSANFNRRRCGHVEPGRAQYDRSCTRAEGSDHERLWIENLGWTSDGLGWRGPHQSNWTHQGIAPESMFPFQVIDTKCLAPVRIDGVDLKAYEFVVRTHGRRQVETLFVNATTGLPVRFDTRPDGRDGVSTQTTYRYDAALRLDPPVVDLGKRWATAMERFNAAVARSDPACRSELLDVIRRGGSAAFRYEIKGDLWDGVWGVNGIFVPPRSLHYRIEGVPYHGGGSELITIGDDDWIKTVSADWKVLERRSANTMIDSFVPSAEYVGYAQCLGSTEIEGQAYLIYEYDFYADVDAARQRGGTRRILVDATTQFPARVEHTTNYGRQSEVRHYDTALRIKPPMTVQPLPVPVPPAVPFEEFRRRLFSE
jgi:hypothetical protein